jgi:tetratricopeptide (TPR) repeat protein
MKFIAQVGLGLVLCLTIGSLSPAMAGGPYQDVGEEVYNEAKAKWFEVIKRDPKNVDAYFQIIKILGSERIEAYWFDCMDQEIKVYRQAIAAIEGNAELHFSLGQALMSDPSNDGYCAEGHLGDKSQIQARKREGLSHIRLAIQLQPQNKDYQVALDQFLQACKESDLCPELP